MCSKMQTVTAKGCTRIRVKIVKIILNLGEDVAGVGWIGLITQNWPICIIHVASTMENHEMLFGFNFSAFQWFVRHVVFCFNNCIALRAFRACSHFDWERTTRTPVYEDIVLREIDRLLKACLGASEHVLGIHHSSIMHIQLGGMQHS